MTLDPARTAVILVEFQRQWTDPGLYRSLISRQLDKRSVVANTVELVRQARSTGATIVHAPLVIDPENKRGWLAGITRGRVFRKGTTQAALIDGVHRDGDLIVTGRYAFDAFKGSNLEELLHSRGIEAVLIAGFTTDQCVARTGRSAAKLGFDTHLLKDCTATFSGRHQRSVERKFGDRMLTNQLALQLLAGPNIS